MEILKITKNDINHQHQLIKEHNKKIKLNNDKLTKTIIKSNCDIIMLNMLKCFNKLDTRDNMDNNYTYERTSIFKKFKLETVDDFKLNNCDNFNKIESHIKKLGIQFKYDAIHTAQYNPSVSVCFDIDKLEMDITSY